MNPFADVSVQRLPHAQGLPLPRYETEGAAGMDLTAALADGETLVLAPGEVKVILINLGQDAFTIERGTRIAQMIIAPVTQARLREVETLDETARGAGGFGSTGTKG